MDEYGNLETRIAAFIGREAATDAEFDALALEAYRFQRRANAPFARYCDYLRRPLELWNWREIPAVPQQTFKQFALRSFAEDETVRTFRTSGTTGEGFGEHHFRSLRLYEAAALRGWHAAGLPVAKTTLVLTPRAADAPHSSLSYMMSVVAPDAQYFIRADGRLAFTELQTATREICARGEPCRILGTALAFVGWFERLARAGESWTLPRGSWTLETGGYKGARRSLSRAELHERFGEFLGLAPDAIVNEYGMTELSSQWYARGAEPVHRSGHWTRAVIVNPETGAEVSLGESGLLRLVDLANLGSVLAVQTQDLAIRRAEGFELLGRDPGALPRGCSRAADELISA